MSERHMKPEDVGFEATFTTPGGERYSLLLKGSASLVKAARACEEEEGKRGVVLLKLVRVKWGPRIASR